MTVSAEERKELDRVLELLPASIAKGLKIVSPADLPAGTLYHISTNHDIPKFIPCISRRTMEGEDRSVPRVCVSPDILKAMLGYGAVYSDFQDWDSSKGKMKNKADWMIYQFDFELAIRPLKKLLPDQRDTDEHWLITYSKNTREFVPTKVGRLKMVGYRTQYLKGEMIDRLDLIIEVKAPKILFSNGVLLTKGFYKLALANWKVSNRKHREISVTASPITSEEFKSYFSERVSLENLPPSANWGL